MQFSSLQDCDHMDAVEHKEYEDRNDSSVNRIIIELYRTSRTSTVVYFQRASFELLQKLIPFDSGSWGISEAGVSHIPHRFFPFNIKNIEEGRKSGELYNDLLPQQAELSPDAPAGLNEFNVELADWPIGLTHRFSFYRTMTTDIFSVEERRKIEMLIPHILEAYHHNVQSSLEDAGRISVTCIVDRKGYVYSSGSGYDQLSQIEWPNCATSAGITENLLKLLYAASDAVYQGKQVIFTLKAIGDLIYIVAQKCRRDTRLTCREREICQGLTVGKSYDNIAAELGITHSTVTTHVNNIYRKLGVTDKLSLARLLSP